MDDFDTSAMLAGLPAGLVDLYRDATMRYWALITTSPPSTEGEIRLPTPETLTAGRVAHQASKLLAAATWHPWWSLPHRLWRQRRLRKILQAGMPARSKLDQQARTRLRDWEREVLRNAKEAPADPTADVDWAEIRNELRADDLPPKLK